MNAPRLTDADRWTIAKAREVGPALRAASSDRDRLAGWLLKELADIAERLGGGEDQGDDAEDTRRLDRIRVVLAKFDWEHDDRQLALEAIERIVEDGQA